MPPSPALAPIARISLRGVPGVERAADARAIVAALGGCWHGSYGTARCPAHDDHDPSFSASERDGVVLVKCHAGCDQAAVLDALRSRGLWGNAYPRAEKSWRKQKPRSLADDPMAAARAIWDRTRPAPATLADLYLDRQRGYRGVIPPTIRFIPALKHAPSGLTLPVMVAAVAVWPSREIIAIHRTYLNAETGGKAAVEPVKMMLGPVRGGAVRLAECGERLAISEGIETGLIAQFATGIATWAALSAGGMEGIVVPPLPLAREVYILADHDAHGRGLAAAKALARRLVPEGRTVRVAVPEKIGTDWADVLGEGREARDAA